MDAGWMRDRGRFTPDGAWEMVGDGREKGWAGWWNGLGNSGLELEHFLFTGEVGGIEAGSGGRCTS